MRSNKVGHTLHVIGANYLVLRGRYDPGQYWFSFMDRVIFHSPEPEKDQPMVPPKTKTEMMRMLKAPFSVQPNQKLVYPSEDPKQGRLPFQGVYRISNKMMNMFSQKSFPSFDRTRDGQLMQVVIKTGEKREEIIEWCDEACRGRYHINSNRLLTFEYSRDAVIAKLRFT